MFIEVLSSDSQRIIINTDEIVYIKDETKDTRLHIVLSDGDIRVNVLDTFDDLRKKLNVAKLTAGAETIARI